MYGIFEINPNPLMEVSDAYTAINKQLNSIATNLDSVKDGLRDGSFEEIKSVLTTITSDVRRHSTSTMNLQSVMEYSVSTYRLAETSIIESEIISATSTKPTDSDSSNESGQADVSGQPDITAEENNTELIKTLFSLLQNPSILPALLIPYLQSLLTELGGNENNEFLSSTQLSSDSVDNSDLINVAETQQLTTVMESLGIVTPATTETNASDSYSQFLDSAMTQDGADTLTSPDNLTKADTSVEPCGDGSGSSGGSASSGGSGSSGGSSSSAKQLGTGVATSSGGGFGSSGGSASSGGSGSSRALDSSGATMSASWEGTRRSAVPTLTASAPNITPEKNTAPTIAIASIAVVLSAGLTLGAKHFADRNSDNTVLNNTANIGKSVARWA